MPRFARRMRVSTAPSSAQSRTHPWEAPPLACAVHTLVQPPNLTPPLLLMPCPADHDGKLDLQDFKSFLESKADDSLSLFESRISRDGSGSDGSGSGSDSAREGS